MGNKFNTMDLNLGEGISKKSSTVPETGKKPNIKELDPGVSLKGFDLQPSFSEETEKAPSAFGSMISSAREQLQGLEQKNWEKFRLDKKKKSTTEFKGDPGMVKDFPIKGPKPVPMPKVKDEGKWNKDPGIFLEGSGRGKDTRPKKKKKDDDSGDIGLNKKKAKVPKIDPNEFKSDFDPTKKARETAKRFGLGKLEPVEVGKPIDIKPPEGKPKERFVKSQFGDHTKYDPKIPSLFKRIPRAVKVGAAIAAPVIAGTAGAAYAAGKYMESKHKRDAQGRFAHKALLEGFVEKGSDAHPGFKAVSEEIGQKYGGGERGKKIGAAILAKKTREASPEAKAKNPNLNKVKGFEVEEKGCGRGSAKFKLGEKFKCSDTLAGKIKTKGAAKELANAGIGAAAGLAAGALADKENRARGALVGALGGAAGGHVGGGAAKKAVERRGVKKFEKLYDVAYNSRKYPDLRGKYTDAAFDSLDKSKKQASAASKVTAGAAGAAIGATGGYAASKYDESKHRRDQTGRFAAKGTTNKIEVKGEWGAAFREARSQDSQPPPPPPPVATPTPSTPTPTPRKGGYLKGTTALAAEELKGLEKVKEKGVTDPVKAQKREENRVKNEEWMKKHPVATAGTTAAGLGIGLMAGPKIASKVLRKGFELEEKGVISAIKTAARNIDRSIKPGQGPMDLARVVGQQGRMLGKRAVGGLMQTTAGKPRPRPTTAQAVHVGDAGAVQASLRNSSSQQAAARTRNLMEPSFAPAPPPVAPARRMTGREKLALGSGAIVGGGLLAADKLDVKTRESSRLNPMVTGAGQAIKSGAAKVKNQFAGKGYKKGEPIPEPIRNQQKFVADQEKGSLQSSKKLLEAAGLETSAYDEALKNKKLWKVPKKYSRRGGE